MPVRVRVRFDDNEPELQNWGTTANGQVLYLSGPTNADMAKNLAQSQSFLFEFTQLDEVTRVIHFDVHGFSFHFNSQTKTCSDWQ